MYCRNCNSQFEKDYCNTCGQKAVRSRPLFRNIFRDTLENYFTLDKGLLYLFLELLQRPGEVVNDYISGERNKYFNPVKFIFLAVALGTLVTIRYRLLGPGGEITGDEHSPDYYHQYSMFMYSYFNLIQLMSVPLISLVSFLLFKSSEYNYTENIILNCFVYGERIFVYLMFAPLLYFFKDQWTEVGVVFFIFYIVYTVWAYVQFFKPTNKFSGILKALLSVAIFLIMNQLLSTNIFLWFFYKPSV